MTGQVPITKEVNLTQLSQELISRLNLSAAPGLKRLWDGAVGWVQVLSDGVNDKQLAQALALHTATEVGDAANP